MPLDGGMDGAPGGALDDATRAYLARTGALTARRAHEGEAYADLLHEAGVRLIRRRFDGQLHGFIGMPLLPGSAQALAFIADGVAALLADRPVDTARDPKGLT